MLPKMNGLGFLASSLCMAFCAFNPTYHLMAQPTLRITSPPEGTIVNAGQVLTVSVEASPASAFKAVIIIGEDPIGFSHVLEQPPYEFTIPIPLKITPRRGGYMITAEGLLAPGKRSGPARTSIHLERSDLPEILIAGDNSLSGSVYPSSTPGKPYQLHLNKVGWEEMLYLMGIFPGREQVHLTESSYVKYSSDNLRVAEINEIGTVHATGIGSAKITRVSLLRLDRLDVRCQVRDAQTDDVVVAATDTFEQIAPHRHFLRTMRYDAFGG